MEAQGPTMTQLVDLWYTLASSGTLTRGQLDALRDMLLATAAKFDGTLALLQAVTMQNAELRGVIEEQGKLIERGGGPAWRNN